MSEFTIEIFDKNKIDEYKKHEKLVIKSWGNLTDCGYSFFEFSELKEVEIKDWEQITDCYRMFCNCKNLKVVYLPNDWKNVENCYFMFDGCKEEVWVCTDAGENKFPKNWGWKNVKVFNNTARLMNNLFN